MRSIIDIADLSVAELDELMDHAQQMIADPASVADLHAHHQLATLFFEPSTRTRLSFESAMYALGGSVVSMSSAANSSTSKGETLADTIRVVSNYVDVIAMRHFAEGSALVAARASGVPVINAGDGGHFHPTQTLADVLTIQRAHAQLGGQRIVVVGDLLYGRTVHSLVRCLARYEGNSFVFVSPQELRMPAGFLQRELASRGIPYEETSDFAGAIRGADVLYMTRIQRERFADIDTYHRLAGSFILTPKLMESASEEMIVLHPLPRVDEISPAVDADPRAKYFEETFNGKMMRMALIDFLVKDAQASPRKDPRPELEEACTLSDVSCTNRLCITQQERELQPLFIQHDESVRCAYCEAPVQAAVPVRA
ncbi:MAG: aspartate carbamoyltransferase [Actinomycetaceae bacterium]|nr:aspartate carbamoyltransferase [Actinomycetaceae bacterium]MDY6083595.1 aspartate carbamoyltransferase [Actinomycetaceae bacterium]